MKTPRGASGLAESRNLIGRRLHWIGEPTKGTITDVTKTNGGYVRFVVKWDPGAPEWWGTIVAPGASGLVIEDE